MTKSQLSVLLAATGAVVIVGLLAYRQFILIPQPGQTHGNQAAIDPSTPKAAAPNQSPSPGGLTTPRSEPEGAQSGPSWKVYGDETYRYRIEYPASASLAVSTGGLDDHNVQELEEAKIGFVQQSDVNGGFQDQFAFRVVVYDNRKSLSSREWALQQWTSDVIRDQKEVELDGNTGYELSVFEIDRTTEYICLAAGTRMYVLSYWNPGSMFDFSPEVRQTYAAIFRRMVSSFQVDSPSSQAL